MPRMPPVTRATWPFMSAMFENPFPARLCRRVSGGNVQEQGLALAAAAAQAGGAQPAAAAGQFQREVQGDPGAGRADRVAHGDGPAVDVHGAVVDAQIWW